MKKTIKVSIGGIVFNIEEDAYALLSDYLLSLQEYYKNRTEGSEIINDVEARMSELLQMKIGSSQRLITDIEARDIIKIMGQPQEFDDTEASEENNEYSKNTERDAEKIPFYKKRFFRDPSNAIIGGVCSGLGHYLRTDPVLIRIILIVSIFLISFLSNKYVWFVILAYLILWAVTPSAKTFKQKISMVGKDPSLSGVINGDGSMNAYSPKTTKIGTIIIQIIKIIIAINLIINGITLFISGIVIGVFNILDFPVSISDLLGIVALDTLNVKFSLCLLFMLPGIILLYLGIKLLRKITTRDFILSGIIFVIWLGTLFYLISVGGQTIMEYKSNAESIETIDAPLRGDTLFVRLEPDYRSADPVLSNTGNSPETNFYKKENDGETLYFLTPEIYIEEDTTLTDVRMEIKKKAFAKTLMQAEDRAKNAKLQYVLNDSSLTITPTLFSKKEGFNREWFTVNIYVPANKTVIVESGFKYYNHTYKKNKKNTIDADKHKDVTNDSISLNKDSISLKIDSGTLNIGIKL